MDEEVITLSGDEVEEPPAKISKLSTDPSPHLNGTARKKMSSFTPKLHPIEVVTLEKPEELNAYQHPQFKIVDETITAYLLAIRNEVNDVEHTKIKGKLQKRLGWIKIAPKNIKMHNLVGRIQDLTEKVKDTPNQLFEITKELLDEFGQYKSMSNGAAASNGDVEKNDSKKEVTNEDAYNAQKTLSHIKKLEKAIRQCGRAIRKLEAEEMSLEDLDDENSTYMKIDRFKKRFMTLTKKVAKLRKLKASFGRRQDKKFTTEASRIPEVNEKIMELVNKYRRFPDFADILSIYKEVNEAKNASYSTTTLSSFGK